MSELAALLHSLKERSGRSYAELAGRCGVSASTLHRYCRGRVLPDSYGMVERIALSCGANKAELAELYGLWAQADAARLEAGRKPIADDLWTSAPNPAPTPPSVADPAAGLAAAVSRLQDPALASAVYGRRPALSSRRPMHSIALACVLAAVVVISVAASSPAGQTAGRPAPQWIPGPAWSQPSALVAAGFYGVTINSSSGAMPTFRVGGIRLWDSGTLWSLLEPARNQFGTRSRLLSRTCLSSRRG
ncbi:helix-turn-helix transcriptional regulator [Sphaerisporangium sp. NPDC051011]|uniref:helix-turn-helix domain-containing protein n=1 Tax=Sphaerisporangium sp. NPDC051011 TaxID=3155792 RepID=UPI0033D4359B